MSKRNGGSGPRGAMIAGCEGPSHLTSPHSAVAGPPSPFGEYLFSVTDRAGVGCRCAGGTTEISRRRNPPVTNSH